MLKKFSYHKVFGATPRCPKHQGVILNAYNSAKKQKK